MSDPYAGNPALFPATYPIPEDSDPPTAANVNPAFEALGDRTAFLRAMVAHAFVPIYVELLAGGTISIPANAAPFAFLEAVGGGGGGGAGASNPGNDTHASGGGGGGGALLLERIVIITPGEDHAGAIGAGGGGGTYAGLGSGHGSPGGDTTLTRVSTATVIARARGANGGRGGLEAGNTGPNYMAWGIGGAPFSLQSGLFNLEFGASTTIQSMPDLNRISAPQHGGNGITSNIALHHQTELAGIGLYMAGGSAEFNGGVSGESSTAASGSYRGGGAGGGGGAGPYGTGGGGGNGGTANNSGNSTGMQNGSAGVANTGAGGGGGGACGGNSGSPTQLGGSGANGGSGRLRIIYFVRPENA